MSQGAKHGLPTMLGVGEVARRSGVAVSTLHFYETKGLIRSERTVGNQRRYARAVLRRVSFIRVAQRVGISLAISLRRWLRCRLARRRAGATGRGCPRNGVRNWTSAWRS